MIKDLFVALEILKTSLTTIYKNTEKGHLAKEMPLSILPLLLYYRSVYIAIVFRQTNGGNSSCEYVVDINA